MEEIKDIMELDLEAGSQIEGAADAAAKGKHCKCSCDCGCTGNTDGASAGFWAGMTAAHWE